MCGIVGAVARRDVVPILIEGLKRLEYRGYDSAGVAVINGRNPDGTPTAHYPELQRVRAAGRVAELERLALAARLSGEVGIAHTRWATHGAPSERNAHPHVSGGVSVVHNGIIENHEDIRRHLLELGYAFASDTDTEVIAHLVHHHQKTEGSLFEAVRAAVAQLRGAYAIAVISEADPGRLAVARHGAPLLLGLGEGEHFAASDSAALVQVTRRVVYLEDGDCAEIAGDAWRVADARGVPVRRPEQQTRLSAAAIELGRFRHYMHKEIYEQPAAIAGTLDGAIAGGEVAPEAFGPDAEALLPGVRAVRILACGTSHHAALVARHWIERYAALPCEAEVASEYRYRESVAHPATLVVSISQSGETADTLAALEHARAMGMNRCLAICNAPESALVRACGGLRFLTQAGPEIGVASTKAFTTQLIALALLTILLARQRGRLSGTLTAALTDALRRLPQALLEALRLEPELAAWAERIAGRDHALFLGRGVHHPIALEGALKLKEISYIHAEAYPAGELKHGPLALVDARMPVIAVAPGDALFDKLNSNLQEVRARGGELYVLAGRDARFTGEEARVIRLPSPGGASAAAPLVSPVLHALPLQLLAYHAALARGSDVDKPRNLAKSVTVE